VKLFICVAFSSLWPLWKRTAAGFLWQLQQALLDAVVEDLGCGAHFGGNVLEQCAISLLQCPQRLHPGAKTDRGVAELIEKGEQIGSVVEVDEYRTGTEPVVCVVWREASSTESDGLGEGITGKTPVRIVGSEKGFVKMFGVGKVVFGQCQQLGHQRADSRSITLEVAM
jgi:hypothetical protein